MKATTVIDSVGGGTVGTGGQTNTGAYRQIVELYET